MDSEKQTEVNMKAAKLLGLVYEDRHYDGQIVVSIGEGSKRFILDIFTDAQDLVDTVKKLGENFGVGFQYHKSGGVWFIHYDINDKRFVKLLNADLTHSTYEEAVAAAVLEVSNG